MVCGLGSSLAEPSSTATAPEKKKKKERMQVTSRKAKVVMILPHSHSISVSIIDVKGKTDYYSNEMKGYWFCYFLLISTLPLLYMVNLISESQGLISFSFYF